MFMLPLTNKNVFITGASAGIGKACAQQFAQLGANVILAARRVERVAQLAEELAQQYQVKTLALPLDVSDRAAVEAAIAGLPEQWQAIDILVNNAGVSTTTTLMQNANIDDWEAMIDVNLKGLLYVTRTIIPNMVARDTGHVVNIGSIAGHDYFMAGNVYSATKHAVKALTRSLRIDLKGYHIRVSEVDPGMVKTELSEKRWDKERAEKYYQGFEPLVGDDVADTVIYCVTRPLHVNVSEIMVYPQAHVSPTIVHREGDPITSFYDD